MKRVSQNYRIIVFGEGKNRLIYAASRIVLCEILSPVPPKHRPSLDFLNRYVWSSEYGRKPMNVRSLKDALSLQLQVEGKQIDMTCKTWVDGRWRREAALG